MCTRELVVGVLLSTIKTISFFLSNCIAARLTREELFEQFRNLVDLRTFLARYLMISETKKHTSEGFVQIRFVSI